MKIKTWVLVLPAMAACLWGDSVPSAPSLPPSPPPAPGPQPATLLQVSAAALTGATGAVLPDLVVRLVDSLGLGIPGAVISWAILSGGGELVAEWELFGGPEPRTSRTDAAGLAWIQFRPTAPGETRVIAQAVGRAPQFLEFTVEAEGPRYLLVRFGPLFDCTPTDPAIFVVPPEPVAVGTIVELSPALYGSYGCTGRIVSTGVPEGAVHFDSGLLQPGERFAFALSAPGEWGFMDLFTGGMGVITAR